MSLPLSSLKVMQDGLRLPCSELGDMLSNMKIKIAHYYGEKPPVPEAVLAPPSAKMVNQPMYEVEIPEDGLLAFAEKHGSIILSPPSRTPFLGEWFIWVTSSDGKFTQR